MKYFRKITTFQGALLGVTLAFSFVVLYSRFDQTRTTVLSPYYHGPNPNILSASAASDESLLEGTTQPGINTQPDTTNSGLKVQGVTTKSEREYGIAAGGGLVSLSQKDLNTYFERLQALGVGWVRWDIDWSVVQPENSKNYHWEETDRVVAAAKKYNIKSVGIITYTPRWARPNYCTSRITCPPSDPKMFGIFAGNVAARYKDSISYWEIWNEQNTPDFLGTKIDVKKYVDILSEAYTQIKKVDAHAFVMTGGLQPAADAKDGSLSPPTFIKKLYELKAKQYFDAVALHPYTFPATPTYKASWNSWQQMLTVRQLMINNGDSSKKIWITEFGAPTGGPKKAFSANQVNTKFDYDADFMSESAQQAIMTEALDYYKQNSDWMGPFFWYSLIDDGTKKDTPQNFFGLLRFDGSKKPAYDVFRNAIL